MGMLSLKNFLVAILSLSKAFSMALIPAIHLPFTLAHVLGDRYFPYI